MSLPVNTSSILMFLGYSPETDFTVNDVKSIITVDWHSQDTQPTDQEIIDAGNDLTTVNGQVFSEWFAENGGDAALTLRKRASDLLDNVNSNEALIRALAFVVLDEINLLRAEHSLASRTPAQLRTAIKAKIAAGDADS
jgi:hypothetical protein